MVSKVLRLALSVMIVLAIGKATLNAQCGGQYQLKQVSCICGGSTMAYVCSGLGTRCTQMNQTKLCGRCYQSFDTAGCTGGAIAGFDPTKLDQRNDPLQLSLRGEKNNTLSASSCGATQGNLETWILNRRQQSGSR